MQETKKKKLVDLGRKKVPNGEQGNPTTDETQENSLKEDEMKNASPVRKLPAGAAPAVPGLSRSVSAVTDTEMDFSQLVKLAQLKAKQREEEKEEKGEKPVDFQVFLHKKRKPSVESSTPSASYGAALTDVSKVLHKMAKSISKVDVVEDVFG